MCLPMIKKILFGSRYHKSLCITIDHLIDLVAAGPAKCHLKYYNKVLRDTSTIKEIVIRMVELWHG